MVWKALLCKGIYVFTYLVLGDQIQGFVHVMQEFHHGISILEVFFNYTLLKREFSWIASTWTLMFIALRDMDRRSL